MNLTRNRWDAFALAVVLVATSTPALAASSQDNDSEERELIVDVHRAGPALPRLWSSFEGGYLGVNMIDLTPELRSHFGVSEDTGIMISAIAEDSPAAACGLEVGDILTAIDGEAISGTASVSHGVGSKKGGQSVTLEVFRDGSYMSLEATLEERERPQLWLSTLSDDGHTSFEFQTDDGENVFILPGPEPGQLKIKRERIDELMGNLHERLASPEFSHRMLQVRSNTQELEERIKELEKRLQELAAKLEERDD